MGGKPTIRVDVVYALPQMQEAIALELPPGACVRDAIERSSLAARYPELGIQDLSVGIFGRAVAIETLLSDGDRVEIYRPLIADPKQARRRRAARVP
jgi:uncharacterized protein